MVEGRDAFKMLTDKHARKRPKPRWEVNIRMDFKGIGINTRNWIDSTQDRNYWRTLGSAALSLRAP